MTTRSRKTASWARLLPALSHDANDQGHRVNEPNTTVDARAARWHAFEDIRERQRVQYEANERQRDNAHRVREDKFRASMTKYHSEFMAEEELRAGRYDDQEQALEDAFRAGEAQREHDFERAEQRRDNEFNDVWRPCMEHSQWHARLQQSQFTQQAEQTSLDWAKLEQFMSQKFDALRTTLNIELGSLAAERDRSIAVSVTAPSESGDDLRRRFPKTKSISPVLLPRGLPDEDSVPDRRPFIPVPPPVMTNGHQVPPMPFPSTEPISPMLVSEPSRRARSRSPARVYSSAEPTNAASRSPSPVPAMPAMPDFGSLQAQLSLFTCVSTTFRSDANFFHNHFVQAEADRDAAETQRTSFFESAEAERDRWFRALEEQREARAADAEFARRDGEVRRNHVYDDCDARRTWQCLTAQARFVREYEATKSAHVDSLTAKQTRLVHLIEVHKHVILAIRTRIAVLREGVPTPSERPRFPESGPRARGPHLEVPRHSPAPPVPRGPPPPNPRSISERVSVSPDVPRGRTWVDEGSPTSSRVRNRHSRARWHSSFYLADAVEFVPSAIFKKPAIHVALPIIVATANGAIGLNLPPHQHHHHHEHLKEEQHKEEEVDVKKKRSSISQPQPQDELKNVDDALARQAHSFAHSEQQRVAEHSGREAVRDATFNAMQAQRDGLFLSAAETRSHVFADGQRARVAAGRAEEARRRAAALEWTQRRSTAFGSHQVDREARWREGTMRLHAGFVADLADLGEQLMNWTRDVMIEYESGLPLAQMPAVQ